MFTGTLESLNAINPDVVTGGEAIAELLTHSDCPLESLDLSWYGYVNLLLIFYLCHLLAYFCCFVSGI